MKKKSLVAMGLAGVMMMGMCVPVFATDNVITETGNSTADAKVEFRINPTYSITIPTVLTPGETVSAITGSGNIEAGSAVNAIISQGVSGGKIKMKQYKKNGGEVENSEKELVEIKLGEDLYTGTGSVAKFQSDTTGLKIENEVKSELTLGVAPDNQTAQAGNYKGTVVFTVTYENLTE